MSNRRRAQHRDARGPIRTPREILIAIITGTVVVVGTAVIIWAIWLATKPEPVATPTLPSTSATSAPSSSTTAAATATSSTTTASGSSSTTKP
jgi:hypothetical protein